MTSQNMSKNQLLKMIHELKKDPDNLAGILGEFGIAGVGAVAGGAAAAILGATTASIPILTALTGATITVAAAPVVLVAGSAVAAGAAAYGLVKFVKGNGYNEGKRQELLRTYQDRLKEVEAKDRQNTLSDSDKSQFYLVLEEPLKLDLIDPKDAQSLIEAVQSGRMSLKDAYTYVQNIIKQSKT